MYYDPVVKACLLYDASTPGLMWSYSATDKKWTMNKVNGPACPKGRIIAYFDEIHNVFVVNLGATTWVYRHKKQGS